jgi:transcriptional regulator with XRE-family HTH domain
MDTEDLAKKIGAAARTARKARRWSQADAAEQIGISSEFYARIERGQTMPSTPTLVAMSQALDVSLDVLAGRVRGREPVARPRPAVEESPEMRRLLRRLRRARPRTIRLMNLIVAELEGSR